MCKLCKLCKMSKNVQNVQNVQTVLVLQQCYVFENPNKCKPMWTSWSPWSNCDKVCDPLEQNGVMKQTRQCLSKDKPMSTCPGDKSRTRTCTHIEIMPTCPSKAWVRTLIYSKNSSNSKALLHTGSKEFCSISLDHYIGANWIILGVYATTKHQLRTYAWSRESNSMTIYGSESSTPVQGIGQLNITQSFVLVNGELAFVNYQVNGIFW